MTATRDQRRRATERRVLDAAGRLLREHGYGSTTIRGIAEASGVSVGTVMATGDKDALLVQVFDSLVAEVQDRADGAAMPGARGDGGACIEQLTATVWPFVTLFAEHPDLSRRYASILMSGSHSSALFSELAPSLVDELGAVLVLHGCATPSAAPRRARALYLSYVGVLFSAAARGPLDETEIDRALRDAFGAICDDEE